MNTNIKKLVKISSKENISKLYLSGQIHANTIEYFRRNDTNDSLRGDFSEGLYYSPFLNFRLDGLDPARFINLKAKINMDFAVTHIYSMYMLDESFWHGKKIINERILEFGDTALIIDPKQFVEKLICEVDYPMKFGLVQYYKTPLIPIKLTEFSKRDMYSFQNEFRFVFQSKVPEALNFNIGSLEKISTIIPSKSLIKMEFLRRDGSL